MGNWLTSNILTSYPFEDTDAYDDALTQVADANIALKSQAIPFLRSFDTAGPSLVIVDNLGATLIDSASGTYSVTIFGGYSIILVTDALTDNSCQITIRTGSVINVSGVDIPFVNTVQDYKAATLYTLNTLKGATTLKLGTDFKVRDEGDALYIDLADPADRSALPLTPYVFTLSDSSPTVNGAFWILYAASLSCNRVDPQAAANALLFSNICRACCQCNDYYASYIKMQGVDDSAGIAVSDASDIMTAYHNLISRWSKFTDAPGAALPVNTPTTAREWVGDPNPAKALNVLFRFTEGTYGGSLSLVITNSLDNVDITSLTVTVTVEAGKTLNKTPGITQKATTKDQGNFNGFPGVFGFGALPAFESIMIGNAVFNNELAGETVIINLEVVAAIASAPNLQVQLGLAVPINGGMSLTNPTETP